MKRLALALAVCFSGLALAQQTPPAPGPALPFDLPATTQYRLANGLRVTLVPYGEVPKVNLALVVRLGNVDEQRGQTGLADLAGKLLLQGTKTRNAQQLAEAASNLGGEVAVNVRASDTSIDIECLGDSAARAVALLAEVARQPAFPESEVARLKADMIRETAVLRSTQQPLATEAFQQSIYGNHPYGRTLAQAKEIERFTLPQAKALWTKYAGGDQAHLYVVGRFDAAAVRAAIEQSLADWKKVGAHPRPRAAPRAARKVILIDRPGAVQSTVVYGLPVVPPASPDYVPLSVTNTLLGGSLPSRITANIREKKGYTYSPRSFLQPYPGAATWSEFADVTTKDTGAALTEVVKEVDLLRKEPPPAEELAGMQRYMSGTFVLTNSNRVGIINQLRFIDLFGLPDDWLRTYVQKVNAVTPEDVTRMTRKYIDPTKMTLVVVGDRKTVESQLKPFGTVKLVVPPSR